MNLQIQNLNGIKQNDGDEYQQNTHRKSMNGDDQQPSMEYLLPSQIVKPRVNKKKKVSSARKNENQVIEMKRDDDNANSI